jgi:tetratricopeptide (TPR) repeat protein
MTTNSIKSLACRGTAVLWMLMACAANAAESTDMAECGSLTNAYGPFDYTNPLDVEQKLPIVEQYHFNDKVEALVSGMTSESLGADLDYTLRAFPNHHRALYAMVRYTLKYKGQRVPPGAHFPGECYLLRAERFKPDDASVHVIYGIYLSKIGRNGDALAQYETAAELAPDSAEVQYNLGLMYRKLNRLDEALEHARIAYRLGYPLQGLKNQLKEDGVWKDDADGEAAASSPPRGVG